MPPKEKPQAIEDPRFSGYKNDPRFKRMPKKMRKVELDDRFKDILTDKRFASKSLFLINLHYLWISIILSFKASIDEYGRQTDESSSTKMLREMYHLDSSPEKKFDNPLYTIL